MRVPFVPHPRARLPPPPPPKVFEFNELEYYSPIPGQVRRRVRPHGVLASSLRLQAHPCPWQGSARAAARPARPGQALPPPGRPPPPWRTPARTESHTAPSRPAHTPAGELLPLQLLGLLHRRLLCTHEQIQLRGEPALDCDWHALGAFTPDRRRARPPKACAPGAILRVPPPLRRDACLLQTNAASHHTACRTLNPAARQTLLQVANGADGDALKREFKTLVREAHKRGIEVRHSPRTAPRRRRRSWARPGAPAAAAAAAVAGAPAPLCTQVAKCCSALTHIHPATHTYAQTHTQTTHATTIPR